MAHNVLMNVRSHWAKWNLEQISHGPSRLETVPGNCSQGTPILECLNPSDRRGFHFSVLEVSIPASLKIFIPMFPEVFLLVLWEISVLVFLEVFIYLFSLQPQPSHTRRDWTSHWVNLVCSMTWGPGAIGCPNLAHKSPGYAVKFEFQISNPRKWAAFSILVQCMAHCRHSINKRKGSLDLLSCVTLSQFQSLIFSSLKLI